LVKYFLAVICCTQHTQLQVLCRFSVVALSASPLTYQLLCQLRTLILGTLFGLLVEFRGHSAFSAAASLVSCFISRRNFYIFVLILSFSRTLPNLVVSAATSSCLKGVCCNEVPLNRSWFFHSLHQFLFIYTRGENKPARRPDSSRQLFQTDPPTVYFNIVTEQIRTACFLYGLSI